MTINKKIYGIIAVIFIFALGGDWLITLIEEGAELFVETLHLAADTFFEVLFGFAPEQAQIASAWTGLFGLIALLVWGGRKSRLLYHRIKQAAPGWWWETKREIKDWWQNLTWMQKLAHIAGAALLSGVVILFL